MGTTPPDDVAAMFDLPPLPEQLGGSNHESLAAEEAALAAELAAALQAGDFADDAPDSRTLMRVDVAWPARMQLADGRVIALRLRNVTLAGVGLVSDQPIPADTSVGFEMDVPALATGGEVTTLSGTIRTTYTVVQGAQVFGGGTWLQLPATGLELVGRWIERLRG